MAKTQEEIKDIDLKIVSGGTNNQSPKYSVGQQIRYRQIESAYSDYIFSGLIVEIKKVDTYVVQHDAFRLIRNGKIFEAGVGKHEVHESEIID